MKSILPSSRISRRAMLSTLAALAALPPLLLFTAAQAQTDPLPSWADGPAKQAVVELVKATTDRASPKFVPPESRIATFDQDGTTWVSHPMYTQVVLPAVSGEPLSLALHRVRTLWGFCSRGPNAGGRDYKSRRYIWRSHVQLGGVIGSWCAKSAQI